MGWRECGNVEMWECGNVGMWKCGNVEMWEEIVLNLTRCTGLRTRNGPWIESLQRYLMYWITQSGRDSSVGTAARHGLDGTGIESR